MEEQLNQLKSKYEALAKLYAQLRKEHLELLQKIKDQREADRKVGEEAKREADAARTEARSRMVEAEEAKRKEALARSEVVRLKTSHAEEVSLLKKDLESTHAQLTELGRSKGDEVGRVVEKYENERAELEELNRVGFYGERWYRVSMSTAPDGSRSNPTVKTTPTRRHPPPTGPTRIGALPRASWQRRGSRGAPDGDGPDPCCPCPVAKDVEGYRVEFG